MGMFDNYNNMSENYIPNNLFTYINEDNEYKDTIIPGSTCTHVFKIAVDYASEVKHINAIYTQGISIILIKDERDFSEEAYDSSYSFLSVTLTPEDTEQFNAYNKDTKVQIKITLNDDSVVYSKVYRIKVLPNLSLYESGEVI